MSVSQNYQSFLNSKELLIKHLEEYHSENFLSPDKTKVLLLELSEFQNQLLGLFFEDSVKNQNSNTVIEHLQSETVPSIHDVPPVFENHLVKPETGTLIVGNDENGSNLFVETRSDESETNEVPEQKQSNIEDSFIEVKQQSEHVTSSGLINNDSNELTLTENKSELEYKAIRFNEEKNTELASDKTLPLNTSIEKETIQEVSGLSPQKSPENELEKIVSNDTKSIQTTILNTEVKPKSQSGSSAKNIVIGINDKFRFINELFAKSQLEFSTAMEQLNSCVNLEESENYLNNLKVIYEWKEESALVKTLFALNRKRYN